MTILNTTHNDPLTISDWIGTKTGSVNETLSEQLTRLSAGLRVDTKMLVEEIDTKISGSITPRQYSDLKIRTVAAHMLQHPDYSKLAARLIRRKIVDETAEQNISSFADSIVVSYETGLIAERTYRLAKKHMVELERLCAKPIDLFEAAGLSTVYDRYLGRHPDTKMVVETPEYWLMRVALGLADNLPETRALYSKLSKFEFMFATPTLFNSGAVRSQMSSCYLLGSPDDTIESIFDIPKQMALLSKWAGGIGLPIHNIRSHGSKIRGTGGVSNGIVPWMKVYDSTIAAVNQGGRRKGSACTYLTAWHADIEQYLEARHPITREEARTLNLNIANWIPDLFMRRVETDGQWSLFNPDDTPELLTSTGEVFDQKYLAAEKAGLAVRQISASKLYMRMLRLIAETGNGWMCFSDRANLLCNQTAGGDIVQSSNLCVEITQVTDTDHTAVCNLGSICLHRHIVNGEFDFDMLEDTVRAVLPFMDRVIDRNFYPTESAERSNMKWRPLGLGIMGWQNVLFELNIAFGSDEARQLTTKIQETIYKTAVETSIEMAERYGRFPGWDDSHTAQGLLHPDLWSGNTELTDGDSRYEKIKVRMAEHGLRNSLLIAVAPTATIGLITDSYECVEPQTSNMFKRQTMSGEFLQINRYLVETLERLGLWDDDMRTQILVAEGSVQNIGIIPDDIKTLFRTAWEVSQKDVIDLAVARAPYIDQSQSLNLFMADPNIDKLSAMYFYAWKQGLKTTYYLRQKAAGQVRQNTSSRPATKPAEKTPQKDGVKIEKHGWVTATPKQTDTLIEAALCSISNPETCESCQ